MRAIIYFVDILFGIQNTVFTPLRGITINRSIKTSSGHRSVAVIVQHYGQWLSNQSVHQESTSLSFRCYNYATLWEMTVDQSTQPENPSVYRSVAIIMLCGAKMTTAHRAFRRSMICNVLIGWSWSGDWQPGTLSNQLWEHEVKSANLQRKRTTVSQWVKPPNTWMDHVVV